MTGKELVLLVRRDTGLSEKVVKEVLDSITTNIGNCLINEESVRIKYFGTFEVKQRGFRRIINISTGEEDIAGGTNYIKFNPCKELKEAVR